MRWSAGLLRPRGREPAVNVDGSPDGSPVPRLGRPPEHAAPVANVHALFTLVSISVQGPLLPSCR
jgi:hypothetical protein